MNKRIWRRPAALLLAGWLLAAPLLSPVLAAEEAPEGERVTVSTADDLYRLARDCALDTWSQGKTVLLAADLDLTGVEFAPIPTFGGTFLGQGHTISGLRLTGPGSVQGLFRYIQPGGAVRDLNVRGTVTPEGTRSTVGGIAGDNAGTLENCTFQGAVRGESSVGGIAGRNGESGRIIGCTAGGAVSGESAVGGIAGRSLGLLLRCENTAGVNLTREESSPDLPDAAALEERAASGEEDYHLPGSCSDTGGVVGYSSGTVQSCTNSGDVGYPHVGYNTGGVAGRQCGYLADCANSGTVHGRKDVGGIVGQSEPYVLLNPGQDTLQRLRSELDTLQRLIDRTLDDARSTNDAVSARLESMGTFAAGARDSSQTLLDCLADFTDGNIESVNALAADVTGALDRLSPALEDLSGAAKELERLSGQLDSALEDLGGSADTGGEVLAGIRDAAGRLRSSLETLRTGSATLRAALEALRQTVFPPEGGGPVQPKPEDLEAAREGVRQALDSLRQAGAELQDALSALQEALGRSDALPVQLRRALEDLRDAAGSTSSIGRLLSRSFDTMEDAADRLTRDGPLTLTPLGEDFRSSGDGLFDALTGLSGEMEGLRTSVQSGGDALNSGLRSVSRQFDVVLGVFLDALDSEDRGETVIQDTSQEDVAATREGKVDGCRNTGSVEGDRNVGGAVGTVGIELDLDPEDDRRDLLSFGSTYETKAVLLDCLNYGAVTAKKDCAGGLAGRMDLGTALECQNYGPVASTGGDYVGGVAGWADASLRRCFAKSALSGENYVGGVAGWASSLRECCAIADITGGKECLGAIAGGVERDGVLRDNRFVDTGLAAVDGVSYAGRAEPVPFALLAGEEGIPQAFTSFTLTLLAEGETVARIPFLYGEDLSRVELPPVPLREGSYGRWPDFDTSGVRSDVTVEAVYAPWVTVAASRETRGKLSLALAEGRFTEDTELHVTDSRQAPPPEAGEGAAVWDVSLSGADPEDAVPLRLLAPEEGEVWQYLDGTWRRTESARNGQYLTVSMEGVQGTFCIQPREARSWGIPAAVAGGVGGLVLLLLAGRRRKRAVPAKGEEGHPGGEGELASSGGKDSG